jgi:hypothetical protein
MTISKPGSPAFISTSKYRLVGKIKHNGSDRNGVRQGHKCYKRYRQAPMGFSYRQFLCRRARDRWFDINAAPGVVLVIDAKNMNVQHVFAVDPSQCRGPQVNGDCSKSADTARLFRP